MAEHPSDISRNAQTGCAAQAPIRAHAPVSSDRHADAGFAGAGFVGAFLVRINIAPMIIGCTVLAIVFSEIVAAAVSLVMLGTVPPVVFAASFVTPLVVAPVCLAFFATVITRLRREMAGRMDVEAALRRSEASLANAQRIAKLGSWDWDIIRGELHWSDENYRIFGLEPGGFGATYEAFLRAVHPDDRRLVREAVDRAIHQKAPYRLEHRIILPDGRVRIVYERGEVQFAEDGRPLRMSGTVQDITRRKETEAVLRKAKEAAESASRSKSEFLANTSHELRTPLNAIIGFSDMIKDAILGPVGEPKYVEYARDINESGRHLLALINDILDLSKVEAGKADLDEEEITLAAILGPCLSLLREGAEAGNLTLESRIPDDLPSLRADARRLKQILLNLLSNAIKFTPPGGHVTIAAEVDADGALAIEIADTGIGIAAKDIPQALAPFSQVEGGFSRNHGGTGLGLPLAEALVRLHQGRLELVSEPGIGTVVTVHLPAERLVYTAAD